MALLAACGGGNGDSSGADSPAPDRHTLALARPGDLLAQAQRTLRARPSGSRLPLLAVALGTAGDASLGATLSPVITATAPPAATPTAAGGALRLETGIDEADLLAADASGSLLWSIDASASGMPQVQAHQRHADGRLVPLLRAPMAREPGSSLDAHGLLPAPDGRSATAIASSWATLGLPDVCRDEVCLAQAGSGAGSSQAGGVALAMVAPRWAAPRVRVQRFTLDAAAGSASPSDWLDIDGELVEQRRVGDRLLLVTRHRPVLALDLLPLAASASQREAAIQALSTAALLPRLRRPGMAEAPLVQETDCWLPAEAASPWVEYTTVSLIDLSQPQLQPVSRCFGGGAEALHLSGNRLVLAMAEQPYTVGEQGAVYAESTRTRLHVFGLNGHTLSWRASGSVPGHLGWDRARAAYRLSVQTGVQGDDVRVLTYTGATGWSGDRAAAGVAPSPATLSILRESAATPGLLALHGSLPHAQRPQPIGKPGEQVYGVRFVGDRAYVVTFRETDPLYVLDLSRPDDPQIAGELVLPGFADHLLPLPEGLLLGIGHDADATGRRQGIQLSLFDVRDAARPALLQRLALGAAGSLSALDFSPRGGSLVAQDAASSRWRLALPLALSSSDWGPPLNRLQLAEVDTQARTLTLGPALGTGDDASGHDLWHQRALQFGDTLVWLRQGSLGLFSAN